jgi:hypothetical protein
MLLMPVGHFRHEVRNGVYVLEVASLGEKNVPCMRCSEEVYISVMAKETDLFFGCKDLYLTLESRPSRMLMDALLFWRANHPRMRIDRSRCRSAKIVSVGNFGSLVIAMVAPRGSLVFRHREYAETVVFDGRKVESFVKEPDKGASRGHGLHVAGGKD